MKTVQIKGNGTSLWGESNGTYNVKKVVLNYFAEENNTVYAEVQLFGSNTKWTHYTDTAIEKNVQKSKTIINEIKKQAKETHGYDLTDIKIDWSEQGMQPDKGWSFDMKGTIAK